MPDDRRYESADLEDYEVLVRDEGPDSGGASAEEAAIHYRIDEG